MTTVTMHHLVLCFWHIKEIIILTNCQKHVR